MSYVLIAILSIIIDTLILRFLTETLNIFYIISKIGSTVFSTGINYILKRWVYEKYRID